MPRSRCGCRLCNRSNDCSHFSVSSESSIDTTTSTAYLLNKCAAKFAIRGWAFPSFPGDLPVSAGPKRNEHVRSRTPYQGNLDPTEAMDELGNQAQITRWACLEGPSEASRKRGAYRVPVPHEPLPFLKLTAKVFVLAPALFLKAAHVGESIPNNPVIVAKINEGHHVSPSCSSASAS